MYTGPHTTRKNETWTYKNSEFQRVFQGFVNRSVKSLADKGYFGQNIDFLKESIEEWKAYLDRLEKDNIDSHYSISDDSDEEHQPRIVQ